MNISTLRRLEPSSDLHSSAALRIRSPFPDSTVLELPWTRPPIFLEQRSEAMSGALAISSMQIPESRLRRHH